MTKLLYDIKTTLTLVVCTGLILGMGTCPSGNNQFTLISPPQKSSLQPLNSTKGKDSIYEKMTEIILNVKNSSGKTLYITCFAHMQKRALLSIWRITKSDILTLENGASGKIKIECPLAQEVIKNIYGYLGVFDTIKEAQDSTFELMDDRKKLDLDLLYKIGNNVIDLKIDKISSEKQIVEYEFTKKGAPESRKNWQNLDFYVQNQSGKPLLIVAFMYKQEEGMIKDSVWDYKKTAPFKLMPNETTLVDLESIKSKEDAMYVRGVLAIFDQDQEEKAKKITYSMLDFKRVVELDRLHNIAGKKIVLKVQKYGLKGLIPDYTVVEAKSPINN